MNFENSAQCKFDIYNIENGDKEACEKSWGSLGSSSKSLDWSDNVGSDPYGEFESGSMSLISEGERKSKLPAGWEERIVGTTKESYFFDTITRKVYFTLPPSDQRGAERDVWNGSPGCKLRCRHILVKHKESDRCSSYRVPVVNRTKQEALHKILQTRDLVGGSGEAEFAALARAISDCCSARHGGDLGPLRLTQTSFGFEQNILLLDTPELSEIFQTNAGYHILLRTPAHGRKMNKGGSLEQLISSTKKEKSKTYLKKNKYFSMRKPKAFLCNSTGEKPGTRAFESKSSCPSVLSLKTPYPTSESQAPDESIKYAKQQCEVRNKIVHDKLDETMHLCKYLKLLAEKEYAGKRSSQSSKSNQSFLYE